MTDDKYVKALEKQVAQLKEIVSLKSEIIKAHKSIEESKARTIMYQTLTIEELKKKLRFAQFKVQEAQFQKNSMAKKMLKPGKN